MKKLGAEKAGEIEWAGPRLICIAGDFTKYDQHAVQQINRNIEPIRYARFGDDLLLLDLINSVQASDDASPDSVKGKSKTSGLGNKATPKDKTVEEHLQGSSQRLLDLYELLRSTLMGFGDDVIEKRLKLYVAFKRIKNFASIEVCSTQDKLRCWVKVNPESIRLEDGFTRDVSSIGHWGTGDLEITLTSAADFEKALPLFLRSYQGC